MKPLLTAINPQYFYRILDWRRQAYDKVGGIAKIKGFDHYNHLVDINSLFSTLPFGDPVDRTQTVKQPFAFAVPRAWQKPKKSSSLDEALQKTVTSYLSSQKKINLCWSGGIDSTCMLTAFLKHTSYIDQLRVLYTPFSVYENRDFFNYLNKNYPALEMYDISGKVYLQDKFDGVMVNGHGGDEFTASLDESFFDSVGYEFLHKPWQSLIQDPTLQEFCKQYFALAQRPIETVLEARWWFYAVTKNNVHSPRDNIFDINTPANAFYDCQEFEDYMWHNTNEIITSDNYNSYKKFLKKYIYDFDKNDKFYQLARKVSSPQFLFYTRKKTELLDQQWIAFLEDNTIIRTANLPLFSQLEFEKTYGDSLEYLFQHP